MGKTYSYIALGIAIVVFIYSFFKTGEIGFSLALAGIGFVWFLFENFFKLFSLTRGKSNKKFNDEKYKKDKEALNKATDNNPTLR